MATSSASAVGEPSEAESSLKYRAFISYSHKDKKWGRWLHRALERYRAPRGMTDRPGSIRPVFRDDEELTPGPDLTASIKTALDDSEALVVVCSPAGASSPWVDREILYFKGLGRQDRIFAVVVAGSMEGGASRSFPLSLIRKLAPDGTLSSEVVEPLAVDVRSHGKKDTLLKIAAGLLGVPFDDLKRRDRRRRLWRIALIATAIITVLAAYTASLLLQARALNRQLSSILTAVSQESTDRGDHGRALRLAMLAARSSLLSPPAEGAEPNLVRAAHYSTLEGLFEGHVSAVYSVAYDASGERLLTGSQDGTVRIWHRAAHRSWIQCGPPIETRHVIDARFVELGDAVVVQSASGSVQRWRVEGDTWRADEPFSGVAQGAARADFRAFATVPSGDLVALGRQDRSLTLWRFREGSWEREADLDVKGELPTSVALSPGGEWLAAGFLGGQVRFWSRVQDGRWEPRATSSTSQVEPRTLRFSSSGQRLLIIRLGDVQVLDYKAGAGWVDAGRLNADRMTTRGELAASNDRFLVTNGTDELATLWFEESPRKWVMVEEFQGDGDSTRMVAFAPDSGRFATVGNRGTVRIWGPGALGSWRSFAKVRRNIGLVRDVQRWTGDHTAFDEPVALSPDGRRRVRGTVYGIVHITDVATGAEVAAFDASESPLYRLEFSDRGERLKVLDPSTDRELRAIDTRFSVALRGDALLDALCRERLHPPLSIVSEADVEAAPLIRNRKGDDVCVPPSFFAHLRLALSWLSQP